jgi:hypothetical protein
MDFALAIPLNKNLDESKALSDEKFTINYIVSNR